jgi:hypothetical protein
MVNLGTKLFGLWRKGAMPPGTPPLFENIYILSNVAGDSFSRIKLAQRKKKRNNRLTPLWPLLKKKKKNILVNKYLNLSKLKVSII